MERITFREYIIEPLANSAALTSFLVMFTSTLIGEPRYELGAGIASLGLADGLKGLARSAAFGMAGYILGEGFRRMLQG